MISYDRENKVLTASGYQGCRLIRLSWDRNIPYNEEVWTDNSVYEDKVQTVVNPDGSEVQQTVRVLVEYHEPTVTYIPRERQESHSIELPIYEDGGGEIAGIDLPEEVQVEEILAPEFITLL